MQYNYLGLSVALLSLLVVFCGCQRFPFVRVAWSLGGLGFFEGLEVLFYLKVFLIQFFILTLLLYMFSRPPHGVMLMA